MFNPVHLEKIYSVIIGLKNDEELMNSLRSLKDFDNTIKQNNYINSAMFLYNNGNLSATEKKEILSNVKSIYQSLGNELEPKSKVKNVKI